MTTTATLTVGQQIGPFVVSAMTDEKVCLYDASAQGYRHAKSQRWAQARLAGPRRNPQAPPDRGVR
jgi:hypothetical protein